MTLRVLAPGLLATVQDLGRPGHQQAGVTVGGAMDPVALRVANLLVGNPPGAAGLELTLLGPRLRFDAPTLFALAGADLQARLDDRPVPRGRPTHAPADSTLVFGGARLGCRAYLAVAGGIDVPTVLGSRSTYVRAALGGLEGRALRPGDLLPVGQASGLSARIAAAVAPGSVARWGAAASLIRLPPSGGAEVRVLAGTHLGALDATSRERFTDALWTVAPQSDRMGVRLAGGPLNLSTPLELRSEAVADGTVQLPPAGEPIVLLADRQTTGGYPRIAQVAAVDLPVLAQLRPGDGFRFRMVSLAEAEAWYVERERELEMLGVGVGVRG